MKLLNWEKRMDLFIQEDVYGAWKVCLVYLVGSSQAERKGKHLNPRDHAGKYLKFRAAGNK